MYTTQAIYRFNDIPIKITMALFTEIERTLKFAQNHKRLQIAKAFLRKKTKAISISPADFRLYYKRLVIQTIWYWHNYKYIIYLN